MPGKSIPRSTIAAFRVTFDDPTAEPAERVR
jgi:hypothetical protein